MNLTFFFPVFVDVLCECIGKKYETVSYFFTKTKKIRWVLIFLEYGGFIFSELLGNLCFDLILYLSHTQTLRHPAILLHSFQCVYPILFQRFQQTNNNKKYHRIVSDKWTVCNLWCICWHFCEEVGLLDFDKKNIF